MRKINIGKDCVVPDDGHQTSWEAPKANDENRQSGQEKSLLRK